MNVSGIHVTDPRVAAVIVATVPVLIWLWLIAGHGRFWQAGPMLRAITPIAAPDVDVVAPDVDVVVPDVDVVVPARDEADLIARSIGSLLDQDYAGQLRVILVDDGSTDGTGAIARGLVERGLFGRHALQVIDGAARPPGWAGKLWALHQGVAQATAPLVLFTDADIVHAPAHVATLVAQSRQLGREAEADAAALDMVSEMVALNCDSLAEHALIPAFVYFFALLYPFAWVNDPARKTAAAAGGTVLIRRAALERIGGVAAIRGALIDDVALATAVKRGGRIWLGHSTLARSIRRYPAFADIWAMVARSAYVQLRYSPRRLVATVFGLGLIFLAPPAFTLLGAGATRLAGLIAWGLMAGSFLPTLKRFGRSPLWAPGLPLIACFYLAATVGAAIDHHRGRGVVWKQRSYSEKRA